MSAIHKTLHPRISTELSVSDWLLIDQARIDAFAAATGDHQWIHVDVARAASGPFGGTIAHGFLTASLLPFMTGESWRADLTISAALNYGIDRLRFLTPVRCGARIRNRLKLLSVDAKGDNRVLLGFENTVEIENEKKPALIANTLVMAFE